MKRIALTQGKFAIVDDADFYRLTRWKWHVIHMGRLSYAARNEKGKKVLMHRVILNAQKGQVIDHVNCNGLDNRKSNIRFCTYSQNLANSRPYRGPNTSQFKGVHWDKRRCKWQARIKVSYKTIHLGYFLHEVDAARAYDIAAQHYFREFARPNFQLRR